MIKKWICLLFGLCIHEWAGWVSNFEGSSFQRRKCKKCGKMEEQMI